jgi:RNA polymerase sigma factor (sigma-70 family)
MHLFTAKPDPKELWEQYYPKVYGYFYRRVANTQDVEDLTSVVMTEFLLKLLDDSTTVHKPNGFLWKVAYFHLVEYIDHKKKSRISISINDDFEVADDRETALEAIELNRKLETIFSLAKTSLNEEEYTLFSRHFIQGERIKDISYDLQLKANTVTQKLKRIVHKLKQYSN